MLNRDIFFNYKHLNKNVDGVGKVEKDLIRLSGNDYATVLYYYDIEKIILRDNTSILLCLKDDIEITIDNEINDSRFTFNKLVDIYDYIKCNVILTNSRNLNRNYLLSLNINRDYSNTYAEYEFYIDKILIIDNFDIVGEIDYKNIKNMYYTENILTVNHSNFNHELRSTFGKAKFIYNLWLSKK